jgi:hypothetical protein
VRIRKSHTSVVTTGTPQHHGIPCTMGRRVMIVLPGDEFVLSPSPAD